MYIVDKIWLKEVVNGKVGGKRELGRDLGIDLWEESGGGKRLFFL